MNQERIVRRRAHRSADEKQALLSAWEASGLSAREFAKGEGVPTSCLWRWRRGDSSASSKVRKAPAKSQPSVTFAPVHIMKAAPQAELDSERVIAEVALSRDVCIRVLNGADMSQVALLLRALAGGVAC